MKSRWHLPTFLVLVLLAAVFVMPLPFGSVEFLPRAVFQIMFCLLLFLTALAPPAPSLPKGVGGGMVALGGLTFLGIFQALPWPEAIIRWVSPNHWRLAQEAHEAVGVAPPRAWRLSLAPEVTLMAAAGFASALALLLAAAWLFQERRFRFWLQIALLASGFFQVLYASANWHSPTIWNRLVPGSSERLRGTFVNPDHFAFYLVVLLPLAGALLWYALRSRRLMASSGRWGWVLAAGTVWLGLFAGVVLSGSRAGLVAAVLAVVTQGVVATFRHRRWSPLAMAVGMVFVGLGFAVFLGVQPAFGRWLATSPEEFTWNVRLAVWRGSWDVWQQFPFLGSGLGTFREAFPLARVQGLPPHLEFWHAHNDFLELWSTTGLVGCILFFVGAGWFCHRLWQVFATARSGERASWALAGLGSLAAAAVHAAFDFALSLPAVAATLVVMVAAALAAGSDGAGLGSESSWGTSLTGKGA